MIGCSFVKSDRSFCIHSHPRQHSLNFYSLYHFLHSILVYKVQILLEGHIIWKRKYLKVEFFIVFNSNFCYQFKNICFTAIFYILSISHLGLFSIYLQMLCWNLWDFSGPFCCKYILHTQILLPTYPLANIGKIRKKSGSCVKYILVLRKQLFFFQLRILFLEVNMLKACM